MDCHFQICFAFCSPVNHLFLSLKLLYWGKFMKLRWHCWKVSYTMVWSLIYNMYNVYIFVHSPPAWVSLSWELKKSSTGLQMFFFCLFCILEYFHFMDKIVMGQINFKSNITLLSPSQLLHELFGEFLSIGSSPCLVRLQLPPPSPGRDSNTITRPLGKPWCSRSLRSPCKFCQVGC